MPQFERGLGLMSGTSLDGLDIADVRFFTNPQDKISFEILSANTFEYPERINQILRNAPHVNGEDLQKSAVEYSEFIAQAVNGFAKDKSEINFIACHGHTIFHQPQQKYTYQMINGGVLAASTGIRTVCDFRSTDVAKGGQGAPLVPIGDEILFGEYAACLNLGGFANISFANSGTRKAFDICPVNIVLNEIAQRLDLDYDDEGKIARNGSLNSDLLAVLNAIEFYSDKGPKSLGREWVEQYISPLLNSNNESLLATFTEHAAQQIGWAIRNEIPSGTILCTGGGVHNRFLMERISFHASRKLFTPSPEIIDFKESLIFALLGKLRLEEKTNCLRSVTGAQKDSTSGAVYLP